MWRPSAAMATLRLRAALLRQIRRFFDERQVLEVETPALSHAASSEVHLHSMPVQTPQTCYLHTSPELAMKRLLAAGSGDIYQICKVFRAGEQGQRHNPEFTLLEWYRQGFDMQALMQEVAALLGGLLSDKLTQAPEFMTYQQAFMDYAGVDPLSASPAQLRTAYAARYSTDSVYGAGDDDWMDLILSHIVQPQLPRDRLVFITHFPAAQASLAKLDLADPRVACRFEVFCQGLELANGFEELTDSAEQLARIEAEQARRDEKGLACLPVDAHFIAALEQGMPACSGVAVGVDRVLMQVSGEPSIDRVMSFDFERA